MLTPENVSKKLTRAGVPHTHAQANELLAFLRQLAKEQIKNMSNLPPQKPVK